MKNATAILHFLRTNPGASANDIAAFIGICIARAREVLAKMTKRGMVSRVEQPRPDGNGWQYCYWEGESAPEVEIEVPPPPPISRAEALGISPRLQWVPFADGYGGVRHIPVSVAAMPWDGASA